MRYFVLDPEVPGGIASETGADFAIQPPRIDKLVVYFDDWLGDDLLTSHPVFFVTETMASKLQREKLRGYALAPMKVKRSDLYQQIHSDDGVELPEFLWLQVNGSPGIDDFGISERNQLVVSQSALSVLYSGSLNQCRIESFNPDRAE